MPSIFGLLLSLLIFALPFTAKGQVGTDLTVGTVGIPYDVNLASATYGLGPGFFMLIPGDTLPPSLTLSTAGEIEGTPTMAGYYPFGIQEMPTGNVNTVDAFFDIQVLPAAAPEPSTWALLLGGLGMLAFWRMRTRRA